MVLLLLLLLLLLSAGHGQHANPRSLNMGRLCFDAAATAVCRARAACQLRSLILPHLLPKLCTAGLQGSGDDSEMDRADFLPGEEGRPHIILDHNPATGEK